MVSFGGWVPKVRKDLRYLSLDALHVFTNHIKVEIVYGSSRTLLS